jgi:hypothetical protein
MKTLMIGVMDQGTYNHCIDWVESHIVEHRQQSAWETIYAAFEDDTEYAANLGYSRILQDANFK